MKNYYLLIVPLILFACRNKDPEILDLKDILPKSETDGKVNNSISSSDSSDINFYFKGNLLDSLNLKFNKVIRFDEAIFPDRFGSKSAKKLKLVNSDTTLYRNWIFQDSIKSEAAFYNWMDCYGEKCKSIYISESKNLQRGSFLLLLHDSIMIHLENKDGINYKKWLQYLEKEGIKEWKFILYQPRNGKVQWYRKTEDDLIKLEKNENS